MMRHARLPLGFGGLILFAIPAFVGCESADNNSLPSAQVVPVHWVPATSADTVDSKQDSPAAAYLGSASCNTTGCHGSADLNAPAWRNAQAKQLFNDPHTQAFRVLYGERSARMYERLELWPAGKSAEDQDPDTYSQSYQKFLQKRCLGCHATPFETPANASLIDWQHALSGGVTCESCHGPAGEWGATHFLPGFVDKRGAGTGFVDTKSLLARAQQCVGCHVGPMPYKIPDQADPVYHDMNHDLIAAGHPRLAFEFNAYWNALPAHWDPQKANRPLPSKSGDNSPNYTNAEYWSVGQLAMAENTIELLNHRRDKQQVEFASYDCFDCHHELSEPSSRQFAMALRRPTEKNSGVMKTLADPFSSPVNGLPRFNAWPILNAYVVQIHEANDSTVDQKTIDDSIKSLRNALSPEVNFTLDRVKLDEENFLKSLNSGLGSPVTNYQLSQLLKNASSSSNGSWDRLIQAYLAIHAYSLDRNDPVLTESLQEFGEFLADQSFSPNAKVQPAVIYDSPTLFRVLKPTAGTPPEPAWDEAKFQDLLDNLQHALTAARSPAAAP